MTLGNMRERGVHHLIAFCLHNACRHSALIDVSSCPDEVEVPWFRQRAKCGKCVRLPRLERASAQNRDAWLVIERWEDGHTVEHGPVVGNEELADLFHSVSRVIVEALDEAGYYDLTVPPAR
jgi:transposase